MTVAIHRAGSEALDNICRTFGLNETDLAALFGVTRPSIAKWRLRGVPVERVADVDRVRELARYCARRFIAVRIPQIVRTSSKGLGGKSMLAVIGQSGVEPMYAYLDCLFSYTVT
jgi:hypothetical protein